MGNVSRSWWAQAVQDRLIALVLAMIVLVPLVATPVDGRMRGIAALTVEAFAILLMAMLLWRARWDLSKERIVAFLRTGANLPVLLFFGIAVLSCLLSSNKAVSAQETMRLGAGVLLYFVVAYQFRRSEHLTKLVDTLLFVTGAMALIGFAQYAMTDNPTATGSFGNDQLLGSFLMILLPITAIVAITAPTKSRQVAAQIITAIGTACLLIAHSRSAWLGGAAGLATMGVLAAIVGRRRGNGLRRHRDTLIPALLMMVAVGFFFYISPDAVSIMKRASSLTTVSSDPTVKERGQRWTGTWDMIKARPITGFGMGMYPVYQARYTKLGIAPGSSGLFRPSLGEEAHDFYLQTAAELGIPGLLALIGIVVTFLVAGVRRALQMDNGIRRSLLIGALGAIVAFAVDALGSPSWQLGQISMFLWLILGLGAGCLRHRSRHSDEPELQPVVSPRVTRPTVVAVGLALLGLLPTVVWAADGSTYAIPVSASGNFFNLGNAHPVPLQLIVTLSNGTSLDVTNSPNTTYQLVSGAGHLVGSVYYPAPGEIDTVTIIGTYNQNGNVVSHTFTFYVRPVGSNGTVGDLVAAGAIGLFALESGLLAGGRDQHHHVIVPGDVLQIAVDNHPDLLQSFIVQPDGTINYPGLGSIPAAGGTPGDLADAIHDLLDNHGVTSNADKVHVTVTGLPEGEGQPPPGSGAPPQ